MKYVSFTLQEITPEQLKQNPITVHPNEKPDTDEGECNNTKEEGEFTTTSQELSEELSTSDIPTTSSEMSNQDSQSDTTVDDTDKSEPTETLQIHYVCNKTMHDEDDSIHDEDDSSEEEHLPETEPPPNNGEQNKVQDNKLLTINFEAKVEN